MEEKTEEKEVKAQFIDPASASLWMWLIKVVIGGMIWSIVGFFTKIGLNKLFKSKRKEL